MAASESRRECRNIPDKSTALIAGRHGAAQQLWPREDRVMQVTEMLHALRALHTHITISSLTH